MPRYADHDERREELANTVVELILQHGIDRVSVRNVAQTSGWSVGAIRYYFPRQEDLLIYALNRSIESALRRVRIAETRHPDDPMERGFAVMRALVPVDETNRRALRIWIAFLDRGLSNEEISGLLEGLFLSIRYFSRRIVASLAALPLPENTDDTFDDPYFEDVSAILHTMWDGMSLQGMMAPGLLSGDGMEVIMRRILNTIALRIQHYLSTNQVKA